MNAIEKLAERLDDANKESQRVATLLLAAKILNGLDPDDPKVRQIVEEAIKELWEERGLDWRNVGWIMTTTKPKADPETVEQIADLASDKCFDWAQGAIAETMAAVAAELALRAVAIKHETTAEDVAVSERME